MSKRGLMSALSKIGIFTAIMAAFVVGITGTVYFSLRSPEVRVPDVVGKERLEGETAIEGAGLNVRVRAFRYKPDTRPNLIIDQSPRGGDVVKGGQTVAVVLSREPKEGEGGNSETAGAEAKTEAGGEAKNAPEARNDNKDRDRRSRNANKNKNSNNQNSSAQSSNSGNRNNDRTTNRNANANRNTNRTANANNRNANSNTSVRNTNNQIRRPPASPAPPR